MELNRKYLIQLNGKPLLYLCGKIPVWNNKSNTDILEYIYWKYKGIGFQNESLWMLLVTKISMVKNVPYYDILMISIFLIMNQ